MEAEVDALSEVDCEGTVVVVALVDPSVSAALVDSDAWGAADELDDPDDPGAVADALEDASLLPDFLPCPPDWTSAWFVDCTGAVSETSLSWSPEKPLDSLSTTELAACGSVLPATETPSATTPRAATAFTPVLMARRRDGSYGTLNAFARNAQCIARCTTTSAQSVYDDTVCTVAHVAYVPIGHTKPADARMPLIAIELTASTPSQPQALRPRLRGRYAAR